MEATPAAPRPLPPSPVMPKPRSQRYCKCAHHPLWTAQEKKQLCCWACQPLLDPSLLRRKKPCANPWPWAKDSLGLGLTTFKGYKLIANANKKRMRKKKTNDEGEALPSPAGCHEQNPATPAPSAGLAAQQQAFLGTIATPDEDLNKPHDDHPPVEQLDQLADNTTCKRRKSTKKLILKELEGSGITILRCISMIQMPQDAAMIQETKKLRRLTRQMDLEAKEIKIDSQLTNLLSSIVNLEEEWKKQEQLRIQRQVEFELLQKEHAEAQERLKRSKSNTKSRLSSIATALASAAGRHSEDAPLQGCQNELSQLLEQLGMEAISMVDQRTAEQIEEEKKAAIQKRTEELEKEAEESGSMGGLLAQLKGTKLKKVDPAEVEKQKLAAPPLPTLGDSLGMFTSLQDTLRGALEMHKLAIMDSDSNDDDYDDNDFWDDDDDDQSSMTWTTL